MNYVNRNYHFTKSTNKPVNVGSNLAEAIARIPTIRVAFT